MSNSKTIREWQTWPRSWQRSVRTIAYHEAAHAVVTHVLGGTSGSRILASPWSGSQNGMKGIEFINEAIQVSAAAKYRNISEATIY